MPHCCTMLGALHVLLYLILQTTLWLPPVSVRRILRHRDVKWVVQQKSSRVDSQACNTLHVRCSGMMNTLRGHVEQWRNRWASYIAPCVQHYPRGHIWFLREDMAFNESSSTFKLGNHGTQVFSFGFAVIDSSSIYWAVKLGHCLFQLWLKD